VIVLDANILISFVLGERVRQLIETYQSSVRFFAPEEVFEDAATHLAAILAERGRSDINVTAAIEYIKNLVEPVGPELYEAFESEACARIHDRDDWPILATALALGCPVWTHDKHFFGTGVAVWTTDRVEIYFQILAKPSDDEDTEAAAN
jgi:predicted nucleic acid-binding protein